MLKGHLISFLPFVQFLDNFFLYNMHCIHNYIWYGKNKRDKVTYSGPPTILSWESLGWETKIYCSFSSSLYLGDSHQ